MWRMGAALALAVGVHAAVGAALWRWAPRAAAPRPERAATEVDVRQNAAGGARPAAAAGGAAKRRRAPSREAIAVVAAPAIAPDEASDNENETAENESANANGNGKANGSGNAGATGGAAAGGGPVAAPVAVAGAIDVRRLIAEATARIRAHRRYPELARRRGIEGTVRLAFRVLPDGRVSELTVRKSADDASLDEAAREAVLESVPLPPIDFAEIDLEFRLSE
jgi:TonB family protein